MRLAVAPGPVDVNAFETVRPRGAKESDLQAVWDCHGGAIYALACALLVDGAAASRAVRLAMADLSRMPADLSPGAARRSLARSVYGHAQMLGGSRTGGGPLPPVMTWLSQLARLQREALALCAYGGLTHREAADLLGVASGTIADVLTGSLRELARIAAAASTPAATPA